jgi:gas vesicle protein
MIQSADWESMYEGDNSPIPNKLRAVLKALAECMKEMTAEEVDEIVAAAKKCAKPDVTKSEGIKVDDVQKMIADGIAKALETTNAENAELKKRIKAIEDQPAPPKGRLLSVEKGEDIIAATDELNIKPVTKGDGSVDTGATLIKAIHKLGGQRIS